jgi:hypothetical protein
MKTKQPKYIQPKYIQPKYIQPKYIQHRLKALKAFINIFAEHNCLCASYEGKQEVLQDIADFVQYLFIDKDRKFYIEFDPAVITTSSWCVITPHKRNTTFCLASFSTHQAAITYCKKLNLPLIERDRTKKARNEEKIITKVIKNVSPNESILQLAGSLKPRKGYKMTHIERENGEVTITYEKD